MRDTQRYKQCTAGSAIEFSPANNQGHPHQRSRQYTPLSSTRPTLCKSAGGPLLESEGPLHSPILDPPPPSQKEKKSGGAILAVSPERHPQSSSRRERRRIASPSPAAILCERRRRRRLPARQPPAHRPTASFRSPCHIPATLDPCAGPFPPPRGIDDRIPAPSRITE
jgi:hypothetical protein